MNHSPRGRWARLSPLLALLAGLSWSGAGAANPPDIYGFGARGIALAGAMTAAVDDTSANFYNPAALTRRMELQLDTGYLLTSTHLRMNDRDVGVDEGSGFQFGVVVPGEIGPVGLAVGLSLFLPEDRLSRVRALPQQQPRFVYYDNRPQRVFINTNLAVRPLPWLHIGGGITFLTETSGTLNLEGLIFLGEVERSPLETEVKVDFETIRYPSFGLLITPSERWSLGVTYREEVKVELDLGATVDGAVVLGNLIGGKFSIKSFNTNLFTPRQLWVGGTFRPVEELLLSLDLGWLNWANFPAPTAKVKTTLEIELLDFDIPEPAPVVDADFHDVFSLRFGLEGSLKVGAKAVIDFRAGYAFEGSPAPDQPGLTNYIDSNKHTIGYGIGLTLHDWNPWVAAPLSIDISGQTILLPQRQYRKDDPADLVGDFEAGGELFTLAGTVRWRF